MDCAFATSVTVHCPGTNRRRGWDETVNCSRIRLLHDLRCNQRTGWFIRNLRGHSVCHLPPVTGRTNVNCQDVTWTLCSYCARTLPANKVDVSGDTVLATAWLPNWTPTCMIRVRNATCFADCAGVIDRTLARCFWADCADLYADIHRMLSRTFLWTQANSCADFARLAENRDYCSF
jgi:hypothetical protein